jgi:CMP/dCMP kinase
MMKPGVRIAISGKSGCGNSTVSRLAAARLGLTMINYTFKNVAIERGLTFEEVCRLAETDAYWDHYIDKKQVELAAPGNCVLGSRLAIWLLKDADLRVFLDAPAEVRANRVMKREGGELVEVMRQTAERDLRDHNRYLRLYGINNDDYAFADLVIDTSLYSPDEITDLIVRTMQDG